MAKDTIGSMVANVTATAHQFDADLQRASQSVDRFKNHVNNAAPSGGMATFLSGAGLGAGFAAAQVAINTFVSAAKTAFDIVRDTVAEMDELSDLAQQIGVSAQSLEGLRFAADIAGSSAAALDKGLVKLSISLGKAREGSKETVAALNRLGLDVKSLSNASLDDAFIRVAGAISKLKNPTDQARAAVALFGKSGADLINVLNAGEGGIRDLMAVQRQLNPDLDRNAAALGNAENELHLLSQAWKGLKVELSVAVLPLFTELIRFGTSVSMGLRKIGDAFESLGLSVSDLLAVLSPAWGIISAIAKLAPELPDLPQRQGGGVAEALFSELEEAEKKLDEMKKRGDEIAKSMRTPFEVMEDTVADLNRLLDVGAINWQTYSRAIEKAASDLDKATKSKQELDRFKSTPGVGAVQQGTSAAFSAVQAAGRAQADNQRRQLEVERQQLAELRRLAEINQRVADAVSRKGGAVPITSVADF